MLEALNLDNILGAEEIDNLFTDEEPQEAPETNDKDKEKETNETTETIDVDSLFTDKSESVGSGEIEKVEDRKDTASEDSRSTSPNNFYSSIAKALKDEGIFPDLDDDRVEKAMTAEDFRDLVNEQIKMGIEERQRRIDDALSVGVEVEEIKKHENVIAYLNSIKEENITDESDKGETLRKQLIFQDFLNRGYTKERAEREVNKSFNAGSDIEDAKEALNSNKEFFENSYNKLIEEAKEEETKNKKYVIERTEKLKQSIFSEKESFGDIKLDKSIKQKILDNISKPVYKDPETGELFTAIQKYERENSIEFLKNVGLLFTLTDGFKNIDKLVKEKVKKEVKKGLRELETTLNNTSINSYGNLKFVSGVESDPESNARSWDFDI